MGDEVTAMPIQIRMAPANNKKTDLTAFISSLQVLY
jgi:hypothetical protein